MRTIGRLCSWTLTKHVYFLILHDMTFLKLLKQNFANLYLWPSTLMPYRERLVSLQLLSVWMRPAASQHHNYTHRHTTNHVRLHRSSLWCSWWWNLKLMTNSKRAVREAQLCAEWFFLWQPVGSFILEGNNAMLTCKAIKVSGSLCLIERKSAFIPAFVSFERGRSRSERTDSTQAPREHCEIVVTWNRAELVFGDKVLK